MSTEALVVEKQIAKYNVEMLNQERADAGEPSGGRVCELERREPRTVIPDAGPRAVKDTRYVIVVQTCVFNGQVRRLSCSVQDPMAWLQRDLARQPDSINMRCCA